MLLERLVEASTTLSGLDLGPPLYKVTPVRYQIELTEDGGYLNLVRLTGDASRRNDRGMPLVVPTRVRAYAIKPILFADNGEYTLGRARDSAKQSRVGISHAAYVTLVRACAEETGEPDVQAVARFYTEHDLATLILPDDFDPGATITFGVAGRRPVDLPAVQRFWLRYAGIPEDADAADLAQCLVCSQLRPPVERLQFKIKGIPGGQTSGTSLISANADAFESYGLKASRVSPICQDCAERFSKALNYLLATPSYHLRAAPLIYAFWTRAPVTFNFAAIITDPNGTGASEVAELLRAPHTGRTGALVIDETTFHVVALSASGGRAVVRDWLDTTISSVQRTLARYFSLQRIRNLDGETRFFALYELIRATLRDGDQGEPSPMTPQALLRVAVGGGPLPLWLLARVLGRLRAGDRLTPARAALIKMVLLSEQPPRERETMVDMDPQQRHPAYLCGRLFAVLDRIQREAISPKATITDRFFGTASSAPATVFGRLVRGAQPHLGKLRKTRPNVAAALDIRLAEIMAGIQGDFPATLMLREQGLFALGFYHERAASIAAARARRAAGQATEAEATLLEEAETEEAVDE